MDSQEQATHFTDLLNGNSITSLDEFSPLPPNPTNVRRSIRGTNFTPEEDNALVSAWLNCSLDAVQGTDQKHSQFWGKIFEYFQQYKETTTKRTAKSLETRWSNIQKATNKFCSYLTQVEGLNQSGYTEQDKFEKAKVMYQSLEKCIFQFKHCWRQLKDQPKWISRATKDVPKHKKTMVPTPTSTTMNVTENEVIELDRPMGRKAEKRKRKVEGQNEEIIKLRKMKYTLLEESRAQEKEIYRLKAEKIKYDRKVEDERLKLQAQKLQIEAEKTELARKESEQRIMMMDVNGMPELQRLYFEELQREIIMRRSHASDYQL